MVLRELALRETADAVETSASQRGQKETGDEEEAPLSANAFVLVCVTLKTQDAGVIRRGWRIAHRLNAPVEVLTVWPDDDRTAAQEAAIAPLRRLARSLKMPFLELSGDPVEVILNETRTRHATLLIIGESTRNTWKERLFGSFTDKILRRVRSIDIYIVGSSPIS